MAQEGGEFPIGAYWTYNSISHDSAMAHLDDLDEIGFNIWSGIETGRLKNSRLHSLMDSAEVHGADTILHSYHFDPYISKRRVLAARYELEDPWTFELGDYDKYHDPDACLESLCDDEEKNVVRAKLGDKTGRLLAGKIDNRLANFRYDLRYDDSHQFKAHFRFKVEKNSDQDTADLPIIQFEILHRKQGGCTPYWTKCLTPIHTFTINSGQIRDQYVNSDTLSFDIPPGLDKDGKAISLAAYNFRIRWLGNRSISVDYLQLENARASRLMKGEYDDDLDQILEGLDKGQGNLKTLMAADEPSFSNWLVQDYFYKYLSSRDKRGFATFAVGSSDDRRLGRYRRYLKQANPHYFAVDFYPIQIRSSSEDYPKGGNGIPSLQSQELYNEKTQENFSLGFFSRMPCASKAATEFKKDLWYLPQSLSLVPVGQSNFKSTRPTTYSELSASVFLALSYGVRGLMYFRYSSQIPKKPNRTIVFSAVDLDFNHDSNEMMINGVSFYTGISNTWEAIKRTNGEVIKIGPTLLHLDLVHAIALGRGVRRKGREIEAVDIQDYIDVDMKCSQKSPLNYIESFQENGSEAEDINFSLFSDRHREHDYFMLVNRQTFSASPRKIQVQFNGLISNPQELVDVASGETFLVDGSNASTIQLQPGEGKLFKIIADRVTILSDHSGNTP